jgi:hypothetical protein
MGLTVKGGKGGDVIVVRNAANVTGRVQVLAGDGNNQVRIDDSTMPGPLTVKAGIGTDTVKIEATGLIAGPPMSFTFPVAVFTGAGDDTVIVGVGGQDGNSAVFNSGATFDGGSGEDDSLDIFGNGNTFFPAAFYRNFEVVS